MKKTLALAFALVFVASPVLAFHDGGVADCQGCHTMHNSQDGALVDPDSENGNDWLLRDATPSDVCLNCHATRLGAVFANDVLNPAPQKGAGNFIFLLEDNLNDGHNGGATDSTGLLLNPIPGYAAGHNLDAPGHGLSTDPVHSVSPGGNFPADLMGCSSCHDPHGTQDFRMLYGAGRTVQDFYNFTNAAPDAAGLSLFFGSESNGNHTAYRGGMAAWCGNCHGDFHNNNTKLIHPAGSTIGATIANTYNLYNGTNAITGGAAASAYLAAVPFEDPTAAVNSTQGPTSTSQVSCITCHRAHASSAADAGRWDFQVTFLHEDGDESLSYEIPNPYAATSGQDQRSLCNKCHKKDEFDAPF